MKDLEIWKSYNDRYEVSTFGRIRDVEGLVKQIKHPCGYMVIRRKGMPNRWNFLYVHRMVLITFVPCPSPMFDMVDHVSGDKMNNFLYNLRWSNVVLNAMNKKNVRGYSAVQRKAGTFYYPRVKILGRVHHLPLFPTGNEARAAYLHLQKRAFAAIEVMCRFNVPLDVQNLIIHFWRKPTLTDRKTRRDWGRDPMWRLIRPAISSPFLPHSKK